MDKTRHKVEFQPSGRTAYVLSGTRIIEAAGQAQIVIASPCGSAGICGKCKVKILSRPTEPQHAEKEFFSDEQLKQGWRLACQAQIFENMTVEIPHESLLTDLENIVTTARAAHKNVTADSNQSQCFAVAVDVGTTTVAVSLLNLDSGTEVAAAGAANPQTQFGSDVINRIKYASENPQALAGVQNLIIEKVQNLITELCDKAGIEASSICKIAVAGNTAMEHLFCGVDPSPLGQLPFEAAYKGGDTKKTSELNITNCDSEVYIFPVIGGFVGGDTVSAMLSADILNQPQPVLLVDIGTNGEIILVNDDKITAASAAAGPAFEGAGISCGSTAVKGAIDTVKFDDDCVYSVIGDTEPKSICGSGLIDVIAGLLDAGVVNSTGRMLELNEISGDVPEKIAKRIVTDSNGQPAFALSANVKITQKDVRQAQLAVGAIAAGINIMLKRAGITAEKLEKVLIAGGFGSFIRRNHACRIGLIPKGIDCERISFVGNSSLAGAEIVLLSADAKNDAKKLAAQSKHIELSIDNDFQNEFVEAMMFPAR